MHDRVLKVAYFTVEIPHRPGEGAKILAALREARVNLLAFSGFPLSPDQAQLDFLPENPAAFSAAMKGQDVKVSEPKNAFLIQGDDRVGAVFDVLGKLANQGISVTASQALSAGAGRWSMILWVPPPDHAKASRALGV